MTAPIPGLMPQDSNAANADVAQIAQQGTGIDALMRIATGNPHLVTNPGLLQALASGNVSTQQASAINAFMGGLKLQTMVDHARAVGSKVQFTDDETGLLDQMHVNYNDVNVTQQQIEQQYVTQAQSKGLQVVRDAQGNVVYGADGTPMVTHAAQQPHKKTGFWHGVGNVLGYLGKPVQFVQQTLGDALSGVNKVAGDLGIVGDLFDPMKAAHDTTAAVTGNFQSIDTSFNLNKLPDDFNSISGASASQNAAMKQAGYDPGNPFSIIAYRSAGKEYQDTSGIAGAWDTAHPPAPGQKSGAQMVTLAQQYLSDPHKVETGITDQLQSGAITADQAAAQLGQLNSQDFQNLARKVSAARAGIGNAVLAESGLDPIKHPALYNDTATVIDLASSFAVDPLLVIGNAAKAAKLTQVGLQGFKDSAFSQRIHDVLLSPANPLTQAYRANVQRGMQRFIDNVNGIRQVTEAGAAESVEGAQKIAAHYADIRATTPGLEPLIGDFTGRTRMLADEAGKPVVDNGPIITRGEPVTNLQEAADYLGSILAYTRLISGRAAIEWNLMPGALSSFGSRALIKAPLARLVGRSAAMSVGNAADAMKILPWANNAVDDSNRVVAAAGNVTRAQQALDKAIGARDAALSGEGSVATATKTLAAHETAITALQDQVEAAGTDLASARRAAETEVQFSPKLTGETRANLLRRGTLDGTGFNPGNYIAANAERAARRLSSFLPRNLDINLADSSSTDKIYKFLQLYTSRGEAALGAAKWAAADEGTRRTMISGIQAQVMHAAGYGATEAGRAELERVYRLMDNPFNPVDDTVEGHRYSLNGEDVYDDPRLGGQPAHYGLLPSHVQTTWTLPSFGMLAKNAAQSALWRRTFGPMFQSKIADLMTFGFKTFQLMKPSTWTRNMVEGLGNSAFRGELGATLRAKAAAIDSGAMPARGVSRLANPKNWNASIADKVRFAPLAAVGRAYRHVALRTAGLEDGIDYISRLTPDELSEWIHNFSSQHLRADLDPGGLLQARGILSDGLTPQQVKFDEQHEFSPFAAHRPSYERQGFTPETSDGIVGADRWAGNLSTLVNEFPEHAKALIEASRVGDGDVSKIVALMKSDPKLADRIDALRASKLVTDGQTGLTTEATSDVERQAALEDLAHRQVSLAKGMVTGRDGEHIQAVEDYIRDNNHAPSASWLMDNVPDAQRPFQVLAPKFVARPPQGGVDGFARALAQRTDKWYARLVEDPIQHTTSLPVFLANYGKARYFLSDAEDQLAEQIAADRKAVSGVLSDEKSAQIDDQARATADALMKRQAVKMSWVRTEQIIDDPGLKTQLDVVGRNFFMYSRAVQAMVRRWGQAIMQDPTRLEKAALLLHAAEHTGMIYSDKNGELSFIYPGSGPLINGITKLSSVIPGLGNFAQLPVTPDLTGKVLFAVPGLDNPFKMALSPIVNIPYRAVESFMPAATKLHMDEFDRFVNGPIGAGQIGSSFMPTALRNLFSALNPNERKSQWASATVNGLANLIAADPDGKKGIVPGPGATAADRDRFLQNWKTQTQNQLLVRWALGLFTPASPSLPTEMTSGSKADAEFAVQGLKSLRDEYQQILNDLGGNVEEATQLWASLHPDESVMTTALSRSTAKGVSLPADSGTFNWLIQNDGFVSKYKASAAYFLPTSSGGQFDSQAYQEELALGLRQRSTPEEFYQQVRSNQGGNIYWPSWDSYQTQLKTFKANGDKTAAANLQQAWSDWSAQFKAANPLFADTLDSSKSTNGNNAADVLANLREMLKDPKGLPSTVPVQSLTLMIGAYDSYQQWRAENKGGGATGSASRNQVTAAYQDYMTGLAASDPSLMRLYNGVFRPLSPELTNLNANSGG